MSASTVRVLPDGFKIRADLYQEMPPLSDYDRARLRESIAKEGVQIPVIVREEDGGIIDGHHRWEIATELGMTGDIVLDIRSYATDALARAAAYDFNDARRHMTIDTRRAMRQRLRDSGATQAETAAALGVSRETIKHEESSALVTTTKPEESIDQVIAKRPPKAGARRTKNAEESAALTARIVELRETGKTLQAIADLLGIGQTAVSERLKNYHKPKPVELAKWEQARDLAANSATSEEIAATLGIRRETVKNWAKRHGFDIPAEAAVSGKHRRIDSTEVVANTVDIFAHAVEGLDLINFQNVNPDKADEWLCSLEETRIAIRTLIRQIKSLTKEQSHA